MQQQDKIEFVPNLPMLGMHLACGLAWWTGVSKWALTACVLLYLVRMFGLTAGYHRYFSHASYKTGRVFQFVLAWIGCSAAQKGPLWWASHHRLHHAHSDTEADVHSPVQHGFWWAHLGWILSTRFETTQWEQVKKLKRYPELRFLNRFHLLPPILLALALYLLGAWLEQRAPQQSVTGAQMVIWGFFISTVLLYHGTFMINSLAHRYGSRRFPTRDFSRNNFWLALITLGEGWHNNHHYAPSSERQGFYWWEIDLAHYALVALSWLGMIWELKNPPDRVYQHTPLAGRAITITTSGSE